MFTEGRKPEYYFIMTEASLVYYGNFEDVEKHLLSFLKVLKVEPPTQDYSGFYIKETKYGFVSLRRISLDLNETGVKDFLIYRYQSPEELKRLQAANPENKYYVLLHRYLDITYLRDNLQNVGDQAFLMVDYASSSSIQNFHYARKNWNHQNFIKINLNKNENNQQIQTTEGFQLPVLLLFLAKGLFNPVNELKRYFILLKYSNLRILSRFIELLLFLDFIFKFTFLQIFYKGLHIAGEFKILLIKLGFLLRHILLMCGFKSFGIFVDIFNLLVRLKDYIINLMVYRLWHFIFYKLVHFLYYKVGYFVYYRILYYFFVHIIYLNSISVYYFLRHIILMTTYKVYGFLYDTAMISFRIAKLYLLYPIRKLFWFCRFQYNKRIKKYFA